MNNTNRALNRAFALVIGLLLLLGGAAIFAAATLPDTFRGVSSYFSGILRALGTLTQNSPLPGGTGSWWLLAGAALLVLLVILLLAFIFRQGHGYTATLISEQVDDQGKIEIDSRVAERLLSDALDSNRALVASHVSTYRVHGTPVLKVAVVARRGVSPTDIAAAIDPLLSALNSVLGREIAASIQIGAGIRTRTAAASRLE